MKIDRRLLAWAHAVRPLLAITIVLGVLGGVCTVLQARYLAAIVSRAFLDGATLAGVAPLFLWFLLAGAGRAVALWGSEAAAGRAAVRVKNDVRSGLLGHIRRLGPSYTQGERTGELANTAVAGIEALDGYYSQYLPQLALAALVPLAILALVLPIDLVSGLVLLLTAPLIPVFMVLVGSLSDAVTRKQWASLSRLSAHFLDVLQGLPTLKLFNRSRAQIETIALISDRFRDTTMGVLRVTFLSALILEMLATISTAVVAVEIGVRLLYGKLAFEQAFFVLILAPEFYLPLRLLGQRFHAGVAGVTAARRIFEVLQTPAPPEAGEESDAPRPGTSSCGRSPTHGPGVTATVAPGPLLGRPGAPQVCFEDVHYAYEDGTRPALAGVSLAIAAGQRVAVIGPTGSGKSTLAQLLLRFIEPQRGRITANGLPLSRWPVADWRRLIAWVPQAPYLFYGTVEENIRLARPAAAHEDVCLAARRAQAHDFIRALPDGYDTWIGERGARLSGGQAQRIALARAFLKDAPLVVFDEATANLDAQSEALVQEALAALLVERSALIITHRLSTIAGADRIFVLRGGRVAEAGTHVELLAVPGLYRQLVSAG